MADLKVAYDTTTAMTITLASMAESATHVTGREATAVSNTTNLYTDYLLSGKITTGTSPTSGEEIRVYLVGEVDDAPEWPDVFDGTDSAETWTSANVRNAAAVLAKVITVDSNSDRTYHFGPLSVASKFGGVVPRQWTVFVSHSTDVNLNATGGNHAIWYTGVYYTSA